MYPFENYTGGKYTYLNIESIDIELDSRYEIDGIDGTDGIDIYEIIGETEIIHANDAEASTDGEDDE